MLSRVANSIYWASRYLERAENIARFISVNLHLTLDLFIEDQSKWDSLVKITGDQETFTDRYSDFNQENVLHFLTFDRKYPNSIISCVEAGRENARSIREILSTEMWEQINQFYLFMNDASKQKLFKTEPHKFFEQIKTHHQLFIGLWEGTMSHGEAWHFMNLGRMLERADKTSRILDVKYFILLPEVEYVGTPYDNLQWAAVLKSTSAFEMYRKEYQRIAPNNVAEFLIFSGTFPRAIRQCIAQAQYSLHRITGTQLGTYRNQAEQKMGKLRSDLDFSNMEEVTSIGLHQYLDHLQLSLNEVGDAVRLAFFAPKDFTKPQVREITQ